MPKERVFAIAEGTKEKVKKALRAKTLKLGPNSQEFWCVNIWIVGGGRGGWIESAGGNYPLKLPPQLPTVSCSVVLVMRKRGISRYLDAIFISLTPTLPTPVIRSQS